MTGTCGGVHIQRKAQSKDWAFLVWSLQGMILRLPDYESGALTN